jgi:hypothetical protein
VVELIHSGLNFRFNICVVFMINYSFSGRNVSDSEALLVIDFVNHKIKSVQFFRGVHRTIVCVCVFYRG